MVKKIGLALLVIVGLRIAYMFATTESQPAPSGRPMAPSPAIALRPACSAADIKIKSIRAGFVDRCQTTGCAQMKGVAVLSNGCSEPIGIQVKIIALDARGNPIAARDLWPASTENVPPGDYIFSLDSYLDYDPAIRSFAIQPIAVHRW